MRTGERAAEGLPLPAWRWAPLARVAGGIASLLGAVLVVVLLEPRVAREAHVRAMAALLALGLGAFAAALVWHGRDVTREWLVFGARLGFAPASRRPVSDLGTDRPPLFGRAGHHCARLRFVPSHAGAGRRCLQAELDLLGVDPAWWVHAEGEHVEASDSRLAARVRPWLPGLASLELRNGRLVARAPYPGLAAAAGHALLADAARLADELQRPL